MNKSAVVFAYHNVGVRCLKVLLAKGVHIPLVVTHEDNPAELVWFESVAELCNEQGIPYVTPSDPTTLELEEKLLELRPDVIFSFYYRHMLPMRLLSLAKLGAFNMHGSLLPKYRGRVPVNWAVLHGETETGMTLHEMTAKPDAGDIIDQTSVPILPDDTAFEVFGKLTVAAEQTLWRALPNLLAGHPTRVPNILSNGNYFGGRKPEDGRINWEQTAQQVYNLHRAVAPPYPGAFVEYNGTIFTLVKARLSQRLWPDLPPGLAVVDNCILGVCGDHRAIAISEILLNGKLAAPAEVQAALHRP